MVTTPKRHRVRRCAWCLCREFEGMNPNSLHFHPNHKIRVRTTPLNNPRSEELPRPLNGHRAKTAKSQEASSVSMDAAGQKEESIQRAYFTLASGSPTNHGANTLTAHGTKKERKSWTLNAHCAPTTKS
jgi:hypothetical protein